jgi:hypothetical protein
MRFHATAYATAHALNHAICPRLHHVIALISAQFHGETERFLLMELSGRSERQTFENDD